MPALAAEFARWLESVGRAANTVAAYRRDVAAYLFWCTGPGAGVSNPLAVYVDHVRGTGAPSSAARAVVALRIFHRWREGASGSAGATALPELAGVPRDRAAVEPAELSAEAIERVRTTTTGQSAARRRDAIAFALLYFAGLKATEAISLDLDDVEPEATVLSVDRDGPHERPLPVVPALREALRRWRHAVGRDRLNPSTTALLVNRRGQRLTRQGLWLVTGAIGKRAGLADALSPTDLRRACGVHLAARGLSPAAIGSFLGHSRGHLPSLGILNEVGWGSCNLLL